MSEYFVYLHRNPKTFEIFYVGIGKGKRPRDTDGRSSWWKNYVGCHGLPVVEIWQKGLDWETACDEEKKLIAYHKRRVDGGTLVNMSLGGDGSPGVVISEATRKKLSDRAKSNYDKVKERLLLSVRGSKRTTEQRERISKALKGYKKTPEHCANLSKAKKGFRHRPETKALFSLQRKGEKNAMYGVKRPEVGARNRDQKSIQVIQFSLDGVELRRFTSLKAMQTETGYDRTSVIRVCKGKQKTSYGFKWKYAAG